MRSRFEGQRIDADDWKARGHGQALGGADAYTQGAERPRAQGYRYGVQIGGPRVLSLEQFSHGRHQLGGVVSRRTPEAGLDDRAVRVAESNAAVAGRSVNGQEHQAATASNFCSRAEKRSGASSMVMVWRAGTAPSSSGMTSQGAANSSSA